MAFCLPRALESNHLEVGNLKRVGMNSYEISKYTFPKTPEYSDALIKSESNMEKVNKRWKGKPSIPTNAFCVLLAVRTMV